MPNNLSIKFRIFFLKIIWWESKEKFSMSLSTSILWICGIVRSCRKSCINIFLRKFLRRGKCSMTIKIYREAIWYTSKTEASTLTSNSTTDSTSVATITYIYCYLGRCPRQHFRVHHQPRHKTLKGKTIKLLHSLHNKKGKFQNPPISQKLRLFAISLQLHDFFRQRLPRQLTHWTLPRITVKKIQRRFAAGSQQQGRVLQEGCWQDR